MCVDDATQYSYIHSNQLWEVCEAKHWCNDDDDASGILLIKFHHTLSYENIYNAENKSDRKI